jgi:hypothetical protein
MAKTRTKERARHYLEIIRHQHHTAQQSLFPQSKALPQDRDSSQAAPVEATATLAAAAAAFASEMAQSYLRVREQSGLPLEQAVVDLVEWQAMVHAN